MNQAFFSIILPTYNRAHFLPKAIESVLNQPFIDWELIIIDDGSTDNTKNVVEQYSDKRIRYHWQENQERSIARNNGIKIANGKYICFLDSDDYYLENHLSHFFEALQNHNFPVAFFYSNILFEKLDGNIEKHVPNEEFTGDLAFILRTTIHSQQTCIHRDILQKHLFNKLFKVGEDIELWMRIFDEYPVHHLTHHSIVVVQHNERTISRLNTDAYKSIITLYHHIFAKPNPGNKIPYSYRQFLYSSVYFGIAKSCMLNRKKWLAIYYLSKAVCLKPFVKYVKYRINLIFKLLFVPNYCEVFIKENAE